MGKKISLADALKEANGNKTSGPIVESPPVLDKKGGAEIPPIRKGKKVIAGHFNPATSKQLKQIALDKDTTVQNLLVEALNDLFAKYNYHPIA